MGFYLHSCLSYSFLHNKKSNLWFAHHPMSWQLGLGLAEMARLLHLMSTRHTPMTGLIHVAGGGWLAVSKVDGSNWPKCHSHSSRLAWISSCGCWVLPIASESKLQCLSIFQASAWDMFAYVPLTKASHKIQVGGQAHSQCVRRL